MAAVESHIQPPLADKEVSDLEKIVPPSPDNTSLEDTALAALSRVKTADEHHPIHCACLGFFFF
jgi:hypothetical protein